jgi:pimeloyl-ACP methyl ester carboxylesterase
VPLDDFAFIDHLWEDWSPGYDGRWDAAQAKAALSDPRHLSAAIGYYRAMLDPAQHQPRYQAAQQAGLGPAPQPTLYLHGADDGCLGFDIVGDVSGLLAQGSRQVTVSGAGHFLHLEQPATVNAEVLAFLGA